MGILNEKRYKTFTFLSCPAKNRVCEVCVYTKFNPTKYNFNASLLRGLMVLL